MSTPAASAPSHPTQPTTTAPIVLPAWTTAQIAAEAERVLTPNYRNAPLVFTHGEGPWNIAEDGRRYLDFSAGVAVNGLGHNHPDLVAALREQVGLLIHQSNYWHNAHAVPLAADLCARFSAANSAATGKEEPSRCFFCNSGAEGTEATVKMARRFHAIVQGKARPGVVTVHGSFHGRTYAAMTATAQPKYQEGFAPLVPDFRYAEFGDLESIAAQIDDTVGAVLIEVVQKKGGVRVPPPGFFAGLRQLCTDKGVLLCLDEVQTGLGRTGTFFAFEQEGIDADIIWLAKALGGGVPVGAVLAKAHVAAAFAPGTHASTFGGNALACVAGRVTLAIFDRDNLVAHTAAVGDYLLQQLQAAFLGQPYVVDVRGRGLMCGVQVTGDPRAVVEEARRRGLLLSVAGHDVLRMTPPLIVNRDHVLQAVQTLRAAADAVLLPAAA
jgi:acetylornithine/N-succinyldiaminopimelate aminotransferase